MINVYLLQSNSSAIDTPAFFEWLSAFGDEEIRRLSGMSSQSRRAESIGALTALHRLLELCGHQPCRIVRADGGKPYFEGEHSPAFSLSHSGGICAAALGECGTQIGLDVEVLRPVRDAEGIAKRFFGKDELERFLGSGQSDEVFLELWTQKEARSKLHGNGLFDSAPIDAPPLFFHTESTELCGTRITISVYSTAPIDRIKIFSNTGDVNV